MSFDTPSRRSTLALFCGAMMLSTGCGNKTTNITNNPPAPPAGTVIPTTPAPDGTTTPEAAKGLIEGAYTEGYEEGYEGQIAGLPEADRAARREARQERRRRMRRRMRRVRRREIATILEASYANRFDELVEQWQAANPGQTFECGEATEAAETEDAAATEDEDSTQGAEVTTGETPGNLACWRKLCPAMDDLIRGRGPGRGRGGFRQGFRAGRQSAQGQADEGSWMGGPAAGGDVDTSDVGVEFPAEDITQAELQALMDEARANGKSAGEEAFEAAQDERQEARSERRQERLEAYRSRLRRRLPEAIAEAADACIIESTGEASDDPDDGILGSDDCGCEGEAAEVDGEEVDGEETDAEAAAP